jgi:predicted negative regulator of RcsB-dependent stress response
MTPRFGLSFVAVCLAALFAAGWRLQSQTASPQTVEAAYRANNIGVAHLEQYDFETAVASFRRALEQDGSLAIARLNLGIALFYAGQTDAARPELERARAALPDAPHADYVLGLIARATDRAEAALEAFTRAQRLDKTDPGIAINIGQLQLQQRQYPEALASFKVAIAAEPYNATAAYGLATALIRSGATAEGTAAMERFEKLRASTFATTYSQTYLEQGRYAEAIASTGSERGLVDSQTPDVIFTDVRREVMPALQPPFGAVALVDLDKDGDLDLLAGPGLKIYRNDKGRFEDITAAVLPTPLIANKGIVAGDCDNDGDVDVLVLAGLEQPPLLLRQGPAGRFTVEGVEIGLPKIPNWHTAAWLDADHDGDLDLVLGGAAVVLLRNNGEGRFTDITASAGLTLKQLVWAAVPTDYDNRRDIDLFLLPFRGEPRLFRNMRDGTFRDVARDAGITRPDEEYPSLAIADVNKDGYQDFFLGSYFGDGRISLSDGRGRFVTTAALPGTKGARAAQFVDYDNDGLLDLVIVTGAAPRLVRNLGDRWVDVSATAFKGVVYGGSSEPQVAVASGDLDGDGDVDLAINDSNGLAIYRNNGGNAARSVRVELTSRVSNRSAVGTKIEMRAGSLKQRTELYAATPAPAPADITFGLGGRTGADVVRVLWPSGILQAETAAAGSTTGLTGVLKIEELDRKPSSCPYLYTWNGERFAFITDFLGGGEMGYWEAPGVRNTPDPDEYVRIEGSNLKPRDGRYELRITNELEEALFLDRVQLVAVAHPKDVAVHPNEGLRSTVDPFRLMPIRDVRTPDAIQDEHGHDLRDRLSRIDRRYADDFALERIRGYAAEHSLTITLGSGERRVLLLNGWTDYSFSGDNVAAHQLGLRTIPPSLQVQDAKGAWRTVISEIGFPVGRPQTVVVDLTGKVPASTRQVRIVTTMRVYWDAVQIGTLDDKAETKLARIDLAASVLRWRGFSELQSSDGKEPFGADYHRVSAASPWKLMPGRYTREGDVRELLSKVDDKFVVSRPGDEIAVSFDAARAPALPDGWTLTFLLYADGFSKEMDLNSASPDELEPLPFHGMKRYPYPSSDAPRRDASYREYLDRYNTRVIKRTLPPIELAGRH